MRIPVVWKSYKEDTPNRGYWDEGLLEYIFSGEEFWHEDKMVENDGVKDYDWAFSGQITHKRRKLAAKFMHALLEDEQYKGFLNETERFTEGLSRKDYYELLSRTKIAICPSGPETPDTFRFYEALESGCVPIVDDKIPKNAKDTNYWRYLFTNSASSDLPFPILTDWKKLKGVFVNYYDRYPN